MSTLTQLRRCSTSVGAVTALRRCRRSVRVATVRMAVATLGLAARRPMRFHQRRKPSSEATLGAAWATVSMACAGAVGVAAADRPVIRLERKAREVLSILAVRAPAAVTMDELARLLADWLAEHLAGVFGVIRDNGFAHTT